ncbi:MAG: hypothetical protein LBD92_03230 [Oscillospiraceae bacterium]|jgi:hypothetical protein|nr:hypothetical protein [Oscillospiraceae bacterium]
MKKATGIFLALAISLSVAGCTAFGNVGRRRASQTPTPSPTVTSTAKARKSAGSTDVPGNTDFGAEISGEISVS